MVAGLSVVFSCLNAGTWSDWDLAGYVRQKEVQGHSRHVQGKHYNNGFWNLTKGEEANKNV